MEDKYKRLLREGKKDFEIFANEPHFEARSFMEEVLPLMADYFVGNFALEGNAIICTFANGQVINLTATEVVDADNNH